MKHFAKSISVNDDQKKVSELLMNLSGDIKEIEDRGGLVEQLYIAQSNKHDDQTSGVAYFSDTNSMFGDIDYKDFTANGGSPIEAYSLVSQLLNNWLTQEKNIIDILDIKFDFYVENDGSEMAVARIFYLAE